MLSYINVKEGLNSLHVVPRVKKKKKNVLGTEKLSDPVNSSYLKMFQQMLAKQTPVGDDPALGGR